MKKQVAPTQPVRPPVTEVTRRLGLPKVIPYLELGSAVSRLSLEVGGDGELAQLLGVSRTLIWKLRENKCDSPTVRQKLGINLNPPRARVTINAKDMASAAESIKRAIPEPLIKELIHKLEEK